MRDKPIGEWTEPKDEADARRMRIEVVEEIKEIERDLSNTNKTDARGNRMDGLAWAEWRNKAIGAKRFAERRLARINLWLAERASKGTWTPEQKRAKERADRAWSILNAHVSKMGVPFEPEAQAGLAQDAYSMAEEMLVEGERWVEDFGRGETGEIQEVER